MHQRNRFDRDNFRQRNDQRGYGGHVARQQLDDRFSLRRGQRATEDGNVRAEGDYDNDYDPGREHFEEQGRLFRRETGDMRRYDSDRTSGYHGVEPDPRRFYRGDAGDDDIEGRFRDGRSAAGVRYGAQPGQRDYASYGAPLRPGGGRNEFDPERAAPPRPGGQRPEWPDGSTAMPGRGAYSAPPPGGDFGGRGPTGYRRDDERIREDICDHLTEDTHVDASQITVQVANGEVTLTGMVTSRDQKHRAEDIADAARGVCEVRNELRVMRTEASQRVVHSDEKDMTGGPLGPSAYQRTGRKA